MYEIEYAKSVLKDIRKIAPTSLIRIQKSISQLKSNPYPIGVKKLSGNENIYRIRIGVYRVIYSVQDHKLVILILKIAHRKDVYSKY